MPAVLFRTDNDNPDQWRDALTRRIPDLDFRVWPDVGNPEEIGFALVWKAPAGAFQGMTNLKAICSLGQGVDHIFAEPNLPEGAQILRIVDPWMAQAMAEWVLLQVLRFHRQGMEYEQFEREKRWAKLPAPETSTRRVGILGLGALGAEAAKVITALGFDVAGWSRTRKEIDGVTSFAGEAEFDAFLARTDILCCLLPLTPETTDIINAESLAKLPKGAFVVNSGRGVEHPFWDHPKVQVWPHVSAQTNAESGADQVAENIRRVFAGEEPINTVSRERKY